MSAFHFTTPTPPNSHRYGTERHWFDALPTLLTFRKQFPIPLTVQSSLSGETLRQKLFYSGSAYWHNPRWDDGQFPHSEFKLWWPTIKIIADRRNQTVTLSPRGDYMMAEVHLIPPSVRDSRSLTLPRLDHVPASPLPIIERPPDPSITYLSLPDILALLADQTTTIPLQINAHLTDEDINRIEFENPGLSVVADPTSRGVFHVV